MLIYICIYNKKGDMSKKVEDIVIKPITENQYRAIRSSADFVVLTGGTGS